MRLVVSGGASPYVTAFRSGTVDRRTHVPENVRVSWGNMVAVQGLEPRTQRI